ncbi:MAG TPA: hypothetical protein VLG69_03915 [Candidatus Andersenbacteria bacterium]|nr:hypothetical protein [Candidatus Andersenbacteria bacterium]
MKILIVDDNGAHRASAVEQFGDDHEVVAIDSYENAIALLKPNCGFDALLSDLLMPAEPYCLGPAGLKFLGHEIPIGLVLMLRAARIGIPLICVITDANHHHHPMSAALDWIAPGYWRDDENALLQVNASRVLIAHAPLLSNGCKDWKKALSILAAATS